MENFKEMTQQQFKEILLDLFNKGQEPQIDITDLMNEVKNQLITKMFKNAREG